MFLTCLFVVFAVLGAACAGKPSEVSTTNANAPTWTPETNLPLVSPIPTRLPNTPAPVIGDETVVSLQVIKQENAEQLLVLARLGKGAILAPPLWAPNGKWMAIRTSAGIYVYNAESLEEQLRIPVAASYMAFLPDGILLTASEQGLADFWNPTTGAQVNHLPGDPEVQQYPLSLSQDGTLLAANWDNEISVWSLVNGKRLFDIHGNWLEFSPDGELAVAGLFGDDQVFLYEAHSGKEINKWNAARAGFSPSGRLWLEDGGIVQLVDVEREHVTASFQGNREFRPAFSLDESKIALFVDGRVLFYDPQNGQRAQILAGNYFRTEGLLFSPDGQTLAGDMYSLHCPNCSEMDGLDHYLVLWRISDGSIITQIALSDEDTWLAFSKDSSSVAVSQTEYVQFLSAADGLALNRLDGYTAPIAGMVISPNQNTLVTMHALRPYILRVWDLDSNQKIRVLQNNPRSAMVFPTELAFSSDGEILAVGRDFWDINAGERMVSVEQTIQTRLSSSISSVAFVPRTNTLATGCADGQLDLWAMPQGEHLQDLSKSSSRVEGLAFSPKGDNLTVLYGSQDYLVQVYQIPEAKAAYTFGNGFFSRVIYSPNGLILATVRVDPEFGHIGWLAGFVEIWKADDGGFIRQLDVGDAVSIAFSPDGSLLATGSLDGKLRLWLVEDGKLLMEINAHHASIERVAFTPDGSRLVSGSYDGTISVWGVPDSSAP